MTDKALIHFPLNEGLGQSGQSLVYRPWGTRILKVAITTTADAAGLPALRVRPQHRADKAVTKVTAGYEDGGQAFLISWGGGHEDGPCVKASDQAGIEGCVPLAVGDTSNLFMNVSHKGPEAPESAGLTLEAYDEITGNVKASLTVALQKPAGAPAEADLMRLDKTAEGRWEAGGGLWLPRYDPRWHPDAEVAYTELEGHFPLTIQQDKTNLNIYWADGSDPIITVADQTRPSMLTSTPEEYTPGGIDFELLDWSEDFIALRVWFFWLNLKIPYQLKLLRHEVPDAERFDFLIRKKNGKVALACTDLHWKEMWGAVTKSPVLGRVGLAFNTIIPIAGYEVPEKLIKGKKLPYDLLFGFIEREAEDFAKQDDHGERKVLAPGAQAHVPTLDNVDLGPTMTSRDVRTE